MLRSITVALALVLLTMGFTESAGFSVVTVGLHHSASFVGVLMTAQGAGAVAGGLLAAWLLRRMTEPMLTGLGLCTAAAAVLLLTLPNLATALVAMVLAGLVGPWVSVAAITALQRRTPPAVLGRVAGAFQLALTIPQLTSIALGAALIAGVSYRVLLSRSPLSPRSPSPTSSPRRKPAALRLRPSLSRPRSRSRRPRRERTAAADQSNRGPFDRKIFGVPRRSQQWAQDSGRAKPWVIRGRFFVVLRARRPDPHSHGIALTPPVRAGPSS